MKLQAKYNGATVYVRSINFELGYAIVCPTDDVKRDGFMVKLEHLDAFDFKR